MLFVTLCSVFQQSLGSSTPQRMAVNVNDLPLNPDDFMKRVVAREQVEKQQRDERAADERQRKREQELKRLRDLEEEDDMAKIIQKIPEVLLDGGKAQFLQGLKNLVNRERKSNPAAAGNFSLIESTAEQEPREYKYTDSYRMIHNIKDQGMAMNAWGCCVCNRDIETIRNCNGSAYKCKGCDDQDDEVKFCQECWNSLKKGCSQR